MQRKVLALSMLLAGLAVAQADEFKAPLMKDGFWETHTRMTINGRPNESAIKMCLSRALQESMQSTSANIRKRNECSQSVTQISPSSYRSEVSCKKGPLAGAVTRSTATFSPDASRVETHLLKPSGSEDVTIAESHYLGACPAGVVPGDVVMPDGTKVPVGASTAAP